MISGSAPPRVTTMQKGPAVTWPVALAEALHGRNDQRLSSRLTELSNGWSSRIRLAAISA